MTLIKQTDLLGLFTERYPIAEDTLLRDIVESMMIPDIYDHVELWPYGDDCPNCLVRSLWMGNPSQTHINKILKTDYGFISIQYEYERKTHPHYWIKYDEHGHRIDGNRFDVAHP